MKLHANVGQRSCTQKGWSFATESQGSRFLRKVKAFMLCKMFCEQYLGIGTVSQSDEAGGYLRGAVRDETRGLCPDSPGQ